MVGTFPSALQSLTKAETIKQLCQARKLQVLICFFGASPAASNQLLVNSARSQDRVLTVSYDHK